MDIDYVRGFMAKCAACGVDAEKLAQVAAYPRLPQPWSRAHSPVPGGRAYNRAINPAPVLQFNPSDGRYANVTRQPAQAVPPPRHTFVPSRGRYMTPLAIRKLNGAPQALVSAK